jgi:hypothetical protein
VSACPTALETTSNIYSYLYKVRLKVREYEVREKEYNGKLTSALETTSEVNTRFVAV